MNSNIAKRCGLIAIATLAGGLMVNHAGAAEPNQVATSAVVRYGDLDLSQQKDARTLYERLQRAARLVCQDGNYPNSDLKRLEEFHDCVQQAMANAVTDVGSAKVTAIRQAAMR